MPGAETWSAKEYKGYIYTGDMGRGFDVYRFTSCDGLGCVIVAADEHARQGDRRRAGRRKELAELSILRGTAAGGKANFGFNAQYRGGPGCADRTPDVHRPRLRRRRSKSTSIDSFDVVGNKATFTGRATVNGTAGRDVLGRGRAIWVSRATRTPSASSWTTATRAGGVLLKGNIQVHGS